MPPPVTPPISPFLTAPTITFAEDGKFKRSVEIARDALKAARGGADPSFRLAIIDLDGVNPLKWGGHEPDTMDFIASEAKLIALFGAFALRDMVRRFGAHLVFRAAVAPIVNFFGGPKPAAKPVGLFDALRAEMKDGILAAGAPALAGTKEHERLPNYEQMFTAPAGGVPDFTGHYRTMLKAMIVPSSNPGAAACIHGIGYSYISGAMTEARLFRNNVGPWLAGDFTGEYTYARIDSKNDQGVAQAGTALTMAKLMAIIVNHGVTLDSESFKHMETLLHDAVSGPDTPFLTRNPPDFTSDALRIPRSKITHIKLGFAGLKKANGGHDVGSEAFRLEGLFKSSKAYAVAYQNLDWKTFGSEDVAFMIRRAIEEYEK